MGRLLGICPSASSSFAITCSCFAHSGTLEFLRNHPGGMEETLSPPKTTTLDVDVDDGSFDPNPRLHDHAGWHCPAASSPENSGNTILRAMCSLLEETGSRRGV